MKLGELILSLERLRDGGLVSNESPVIVEGWNEEGDFVQGSIESTSTEARCEDDDEEQAVYINLKDERVDDDREDPRIVGYENQVMPVKGTAEDAKGGHDGK